jgi:ligand-binding sensor domain-containing protein
MKPLQKIFIVGTILGLRKLYIETIPSGASITLDDTITGNKTPYYGARLMPGLHKIKLELEKHRSDSFNVKIKGDEYKNIIVNLEDTTKFVTYKTKNSKIISDYITTVCIDKDGLKYIGSFDKGIVTFDGNNWNEIKSEGAFESHQINRIKFDRYNRMWVISNVNLWLRDNNVWRNINNELGVETVTDISFDSFDNIWVASDRGLFNYTNNVWVNYNTLNSGITSDVVLSVCCASNGDVWVGTLNGLLRFRNNKWQTFNASLNFEDEQANISPTVVKIIEGNEGMIWFVHFAMQPGYHDAITTFSKDNKWEEKTVRYVIPSQINSLNSFNDGNLWFSTNSSTVLLKESEQIVNINSTNSGLPINKCTQIEKDLDGNYWIATMGNGLILVKKGTIQ